MVVGIYNADGTVIGEAVYVLNKLLGRASCGLCDITHGWGPVPRKAYTQACSSRSWTMELVHRDEASSDQLHAAGPLPAVVIHTAAGWRCAVDAEALGRLRGDPDALLDAVELCLAAGHE